MRPVAGFERPAFQWLFLVLGVLLIAAAGAAAWQARRSATVADEMRAAVEAARMERDRLEAQLARERSMREALALELSRQRAAADPRPLPTLTLSPVGVRGSVPPEPTVAAQHATQVIELRLLLPSRADRQYARFEVVIRDWTGGDVRWARGGLLPTPLDGGTAAAAYLTGDVLAPGAYELLLSGITRAGEKDEVAAYELAVK